MRIAVFGTGSAATDFLSFAPEGVEVVGVFDSNAAKHGQQFEGFEIKAPEQLVDSGAERVIIASSAVDPIRKRLVELGFRREDIIAYYPSFSGELYAEANRDIVELNRMGIPLAPLGLATMYLDRAAPNELTGDGPYDFVRNKAFALAARQVRERNIPGSIAELGVYQGNQARLINQLFPDRPLYLFDTFTGFSDRDIGAESQNQWSKAAKGDFQDTSIELVLGKLPHRENARICQGFFPDTAEGIEDRFAFVSLDVDLYEPTRAGLFWFYERLNKGGYIFVHDYNNIRYLGAHKAVDEFVAATGAAFVPLPDFAGSAVVVK